MKNSSFKTLFPVVALIGCSPDEGAQYDETGDETGEMRPEQVLGHCDFVEANKDHFRGQIEFVVRDEQGLGAYSIPFGGVQFQDGRDVPHPLAVIHGPQGGAHVEVEGSTFVGSWFDPDAYQKYVDSTSEGEAPDVSGFAPSIYLIYRIEAVGTVTPLVSDVMGEGSVYLSPYYSEGEAEGPSEVLLLNELYRGVIPDVSVTVSFKEAACDIPLTELSISPVVLQGPDQ